jgi:hypothetical protein
VRALNEGLSLRGALVAAVKEANTHRTLKLFLNKKIKDLHFQREKLHKRIQQSLQIDERSSPRSIEISFYTPWVITISRPVFPGM